MHVAGSVPQKERLDMSLGLTSEISPTLPGDAPFPLKQSPLSYVSDCTIHRGSALDKESRPKPINKGKPITFSYAGGKARLATTLCAQFPQSGSRFVDVFGGRGNLLWRAMQSLNYDSWWVNDIRTAPFFEALKVGTVAVPERSRAEYEKQKANRGTPESLLLEPYLTFSGGGYTWSGSRGDKTRTRAGYGQEAAGISQSGYQTMLERAHELINSKNVRITKFDYKDVLSELTADDFAYLDPPYQNSDVRAYESADVDHAELIDILLSARFRWALSEYRNPIYLAAFGEPGWSTEQTITYGRGAHRPKRVATECLWIGEQQLQGIALTKQHMEVAETRPKYHPIQGRNLETNMKDSMDAANADSKTRADSARVQSGYETMDSDATQAAFDELNSVLDGLAEQVIHSIAQITPHLAEMQSLLSQRGKARKKVLKAAGLPSWPEYGKAYAAKLDCSFRTIQDHITGLRRNGKSGPSQSTKNGQQPNHNKGSKRTKPWHADAKDSRALAGAQLAINDLVAAYEAGADLAPAYQQYKRVAVSPRKLSDIVESAKPESDKANIEAEVKKKLVPVVESAEQYIRALEALVYSAPVALTEEQKKALQKPMEGWRSILRHARGIHAEMTGRGMSAEVAPDALKEAA